MRKTQFANSEYYHIYNRGVDKRKVFLGEKDYFRFLLCMREFNCPDPIGSLEFRDRLRKKGLPIVGIIAYCLNPNHYHFILKQNLDGGISRFMLKVGSGYTTYFNLKYNRNGALFQGPFKATHIDSNELLLYLSAYVNYNSEVHGIATAEDYKWCSFPDYIGKRNGKLCNKEIILGQFNSQKEYGKIVKESATDMGRRKIMEKFLMEK